MAIFNLKFLKTAESTETKSYVTTAKMNCLITGVLRLKYRLNAKHKHTPFTLPFWQALGYLMYDTDLLQRDQTVTRN